MLAPGEPPPPLDCHAPLLSLPRLCGTDSAGKVPAAVPYLFADPARAEHWRRELAGLGGLRVGIAWQGNPQHKGDRTRSVPLARFGALAAVPGVSLVSLQKGPGSEQLGRAGFGVADFGRRAGPGLEDVAALIGCLDLVVCVDTCLGHLAGALAAPAWIAISYNADWRWMRDRPDTPWYPTVRLFRQPRPGDWDTVFEQIAEELRKFRRS